MGNEQTRVTDDGELAVNVTRWRYIGASLLLVASIAAGRMAPADVPQKAEVVATACVEAR
ncbi:hypothetical protein SNE35_11160 [Paucibacter sp. R3-3]|uniref:ESPR domain-containing protein n=1 Tax=Roseateles agri TaxID=3098619 RepID=A0ABU5DFL6_9BURK|nr:hypothetical protein [Paucibacter sp. R3-3]MDY0745072.1 hypothetical protein [Paucibacter sp. R3-3]